MTDMNRTAPLLTTAGLSVGYSGKGSAHILYSDLNLALAPGQLVCFMGPNGIGKSTLIRTLAGLQKPMAGEVLLGNRQHINKNHARLFPLTIAVVLTDKVSAQNLSVYELIAYGRYPHLDWTVRMNENDIAIIEEAIAQVRIGHLIDKKLYELSDGQLQLVMIARALAQRCDIILLDEPTAHLDLNNRLEIMNLLRTLAHTMNKAILVATHELNLSLQTADLIWLAGNDNIIRTGLPEDLVLDGSFDHVFQFKGFDLKTGTVHRDPHRNMRIAIEGSGFALLWTKNAFERSGFVVSETPEPFTVLIQTHDQQTHWILSTSNSSTTFTTLAALINSF